MPDTIEQIMTPDPICVEPTASVRDAAKEMNDHDIGAVIVADGDSIEGIVTDRDIVTRVVAEGLSPSTDVTDVCTKAPQALSPDDSIDRAVELFGDQAIRRVPVLENGRPVGIVSLGDIAELRDVDSALGRISRAPSNN